MPNDIHHDGGAAECRRLVARILAAFHDLAHLDARTEDIAAVAFDELGKLYPEPTASAGPDLPPPPPPKG